MKMNRYILMFLFCTWAMPVWATEFYVGIGPASPFHSNKNHEFQDTGVSVDATQYFAHVDWGAIGIREVLWQFPSNGGMSVGIGPAGELRHTFAPGIKGFIGASGSVGTTNMDGKVSEVHGAVQFGGQIGAGLELNDHLRLELRYQHLSNGGTAHPNAGLDMITPMLSWKF